MDTNQESPLPSRRQIISYYGYLSTKVLIIDPLSPDIPDEVNYKRLAHIAKLPNGYLKQQAFKLAGPLLANSEYIVILDTKNHFIRPICFDTFFDKTNRPKVFLRERYGHFVNRFNASLRLFKVDIPLVEGNVRLSPTITPYPISRSHIVSLLYYLESRGDGLHIIFANENIKATEFFMLTAFCFKLNEPVSSFYQDIPNICATIFRKFPSTDSQLMSLIDFAESAQCVCLGIHLFRENKISKDAWQRIEEIWSKSDLMIPNIQQKFLNSIVA